MHRRVMVAIDPRTTPGPAVEEAVVLARAHGARCEIAAVGVGAPLPVPVRPELTGLEGLRTS